MAINRSIPVIMLLPIFLSSFSEIRFTDYYTGSEMRQYCADAKTGMNGNSSFNEVDAGVCIGVVVGTLATIKAYQQNGSTPAVCVPSGVSVRQLVFVVSDYLDKNAEMWQLPAIPMVIAALGAAYPCDSPSH